MVRWFMSSPIPAPHRHDGTKARLEAIDSLLTPMKDHIGNDVNNAIVKLDKAMDSLRYGLPDGKRLFQGLSDPDKASLKDLLGEYASHKAKGTITVTHVKAVKETIAQTQKDTCKLVTQNQRFSIKDFPRSNLRLRLTL